MFSDQTKKAIKKGLHGVIGIWPNDVFLSLAGGWLKIGVLDEAEFLEINEKIEALEVKEEITEEE